MKKDARFRSLLVLLCFAVLVLSLAACQSTPTTKTPGATTTPAATTTKATGSTTTAPTDVEKPVIRFLVGGRNYDPNTDTSNLRHMELTGYTVEYLMLPTTGADEKLLLEMASGTEYDLVELGTVMFGKLASVNALTPLDDLLDEYGSNILAAIADVAWNASLNASGEIVGLPRQAGDGAPFGARAARFFMTKSEILDELDLTVPTNLDEFYDFLVTIKAAKNVAPLTGTGVMMDDLMAPFGLVNVNWMEIDGKYVPTVNMPEMREYIRYMAKLYSEGLIDPDLPINRGENIDQKFTGEGAWLCQYAFWDIPRLVPALLSNGFSKDLVFFEEPLKDASGKYPLINSFGVSKYYGVPRSATNADHAIMYMNLLSDPEIFLRSHIGDEGVHHEVVDGRYFPILPKFDELNWANQFCGFAPRPVEHAQWQARARKTPEMAVAYDAINTKLVAHNLVRVRDSLTASLPAAQQYNQSLNLLLRDFYINAVIEGKNTDADFDAFIAAWSEAGGAQVEAEMNTWLQNNP
jgi:putative aldouronate transport system substrate-binding protein